MADPRPGEPVAFLFVRATVPGRSVIVGERTSDWQGASGGTWESLGTVLVNNGGDIAFDATYISVLRSRELQVEGLYCPGELNSTGRATRLRSLGLDVPAYNRMSLRAIHLPGSTGSGQADAEIFLNQIPQPIGTVSVMPGETWYAQLWYRDFGGSTVTCNFSDAIRIDFR